MQATPSAKAALPRRRDHAKLLYIYREKVSDKKIVKVKKRGGNVSLLRSHYIIEGRHPRIIKDTDCPSRFPNDLVVKNQDKMGVLSHLACSDAVAWLDQLIMYMLLDTNIAREISEPTVKVKKCAQEIYTMNAEGHKDVPPALYNHEFWKLTLNNGKEVFALDLTAAQHASFNQTITAWGEYVTMRCINLTEETTEAVRAGRNRYKITNKDIVSSWGENDRAAYNVNGKCSSAFKEAAVRLEGRSGTTIAALLKLPGEDFKREKKVPHTIFIARLKKRLRN